MSDTKTKNKVVALKEKIAEALNETTTEVAGIFNSAMMYIDGLEVHEIRTILTDKALKPSLKALGLQLIENDPVGKSKKAVRDPKVKSGGRRSKVTDDDIIKFLANERSVGDVRKKLGQLVPKRLAGLEKAGKLSMREDGLKKMWKAR